MPDATEDLGHPVRTATAVDVPVVRTVLGRALADDPLMRWLFAEHEDRASSVALWLTPYVDRYTALGRTRVVEADGAVVAAALWRRPDDDLAAPPAGSWLPALAGTRTTLLGPVRTETFRGAMSAARAAGPELHGVYLHLLGVAPEHHRRGLGRALVRDGVAAARADGLGVHLMTFAPANLDFYGSCGLDVLARSVLEPDGPTAWLVGTRDAVVGPEQG